MARKFLYLIAGLIVLTLAAALAFRIYGTQFMRMAMVPGSAFVDQPAKPAGAWADPALWLARPDLPDDPSRWLPAGVQVDAPKGDAAIFFVHPTSYFDRQAWNAPLDNREANDRAELFLRGQATAFNGVGQVWAPRYRQATFGAFLTDKTDAERALGVAYRDILAAWDSFVAAIPADRPIIIAGHSQGSLLLSRLLRDRIAGQPVARRIVAAYLVGWPISMTADIPALGLAPCDRADQAGCIVSWQSFAEPAEVSLVTDVYDASVGLTGKARRATPMLCINPLTGTPGTAAPASANLGTLFPASDLKSGTVTPGRVPARCDGRGFLSIGAPPEGIGAYVLPGNNYHVFDYALFWSNVRVDAARRLATFERDAAVRPAGVAVAR